MFPRVENIKLSGYLTHNPTNNLLYHKDSNSYYEWTQIKRTRKGDFVKVKIYNKRKTSYRLKKIKLDDVTLLISTGYKDSFGHEIFEDSLIRDYVNDEFGVVRFGVYKNSNGDSLEHEGFYIEWDNKSKNKDFKYWILEGIQLVDIQDRRTINLENKEKDTVC